jgi:hypothetical protein
MLELAPVANPRLTVRASSENCEFFVLPRGLSRLSRDEEDNYLNQRIPDAHNHGFVTGTRTSTGKDFIPLSGRLSRTLTNAHGSQPTISTATRASLWNTNAAWDDWKQPANPSPVTDNPDPLSALARRGQQAGSQPSAPSCPTLSSSARPLKRSQPGPRLSSTAGRRWRTRSLRQPRPSRHAQRASAIL